MLRNYHRKSAHILAVDDEPANLKLLERLLASEGYTQVSAFQDARGVIPHLETQPVDLVLLDLNMPHMDGYEVMKALRGLDIPVPPPVIILTAQHQKEYLLAAFELGARDFIGKPFDRAELTMRVRNLLDAHLAHRLVHDQKAALEELVAERTREIRSTQLQVVRRLGKAAEFRDEETGLHIMRMSKISTLLAERMGWSSQDVDLMMNASPMHDIGKIGIPDSILQKPGKLTPDEWTIMQSHTTIGGELLAGDKSDLMRLAHQIALTHHEKWDGSGYPNGLKGTSIPEAGRICAIADVYDALTSVRPYKAPWPEERALTLIRENRGHHFDPDVVDAFMASLPEVQAIKERYREPAPLPTGDTRN